ncbi:MAG: HXXEE domain-containing protein [Proteobacteria bacterium]|nr:HXXEE domain-containing protein [Pseudomonadota bacterium]
MLPQPGTFYRLIWLMPASFAAHIAEEWLGGFAHWVSHVVGGAMSDQAFVENNAFFMTVMLALTMFATASRTRWTAFVLILWASANLFWDALFHLFATAWWSQYSPGVVTATLFYLPISFVVARSALKDGVLSRSEFAGAAAAGACLMGFVIWAGLYHFAV